MVKICLQCRRRGFDPWVGKITGEGNGNLLQYYCLENPMDRGAGDPDKEYGTNKPPPTGRVWERSKGDTACPSTSQNPSH